MDILGRGHCVFLVLLAGYTLSEVEGGHIHAVNMSPTLLLKTYYICISEAHGI